MPWGEWRPALVLLTRSARKASALLLNLKGDLWGWDQGADPSCIAHSLP